MPSNTEINVSQLSRLVGLPGAPCLVDVRTDADFAADPRLLPAACRRDALSVRDWAGAFAGRDLVVVCQRGQKLSQGTAAFLRHAGARAETLEGGFLAWSEAGAPLVSADAIPPADATGRTVWVTRARPKIDRIACPWLIRRFVDPAAVFLFVAPSEVAAVADRFGAAPFDVDGVFWSHRGETCTFDTMVREFGLAIPALDRLAVIIRAADTDRLDLAPQAAGLLAAALGLSRMFRDDLAQLDAAMTLCDAFYRWCRDASDETHDWPVGLRTKP
ncbi:chromate resistance protein ChrB domain-containing protein [Methylobrevis pamukkalensis]|uniref:Chromate resistance exported protein n=1 Tax=Methylobrevis pamukkalensis TaxID=1439726 RepID=A0A1E3GZ25_9HYPH|nr:chromate resistance protein ChrB domain-containing protein [Methylobrevis pamukkalensis]ODN69284.1 Chromate resistance exported protein [Methylobrevis pamukkalensis]